MEGMPGVNVEFFEFAECPTASHPCGNMEIVVRLRKEATSNDRAGLLGEILNRIRPVLDPQLDFNFEIA